MTIAAKSFADLFTVTRAGTATRVNASGLIEAVAANEPRIDYDPVTLACRGLLVEESRVNLLTYSGQFDNAVWIKTEVGITPNAAVSLDGTQTATKITETASTAPRYIHQGNIAVVAGTTYTGHYYLKAAEKSFAQITFGATQFGGAQYANFNLSLGTVTAAVGGTAAIRSEGNGIYRCSFSALCTTSGSTTFLAVLMPSGTAGRAPIYTGTLGSGIYALAAQFEAGAFPTSYIPTTSSAVTRNADQVSSIMEYVNLAEGTMFISCLPMSYSTSYGLLSLATIGGDYLGIYIGYPSLAISEVWLSPVVHVNLASGGFTAGSRLKAALAYKQNDFAASYNGGAVLTDTSGSVVSSATQFLIGRLAPNNYYFNGWIEDVRYSPKRLTNAELQELTA